MAEEAPKTDAVPAAPTQDKPSGARLLHVKNLGDDVTSEALLALFTPHGKVTGGEVKTTKEGKSKGFGFVIMATEGEATKALEAVNGTKIGENAITVVLAPSKDKEKDEGKNKGTGKGKNTGKGDKGKGSGKGDKGKGKGKKTVYADPEPVSQPPPFPQTYPIYPDPYAAAMDPTMMAQMQMQQMYSMSLYAAQVQMGQQMAAYGAYAGAAAQMAQTQMMDQMMMQDQMPSEKGQGKKGKGKGKRPKGTKVEGTFTGTLKSINTKEGRGFGFIACAETMATYNRDVFVSTDNVPEGAKVGDPFQFKVILNDKDQPQAANLKSIK